MFLNEHAGNRVLIEDADGVDRLIDALLANPASHAMAQVFSTARERLSSGMFDHELMVGVNAERSVGILAFMDGDAGNIVTDNGAPSLDSVWYSITGHSTEYPGGTEIPVDDLRRAVKEFLSSGGKIPTSVQWKPEAW
ncbi:hypothetical protein KGQ19_01220 [Catenulispora sp. NL8]|uniref:Immunity protein Imm1 n=1 Tax=Catenulispora pinistramenti TaxID=2705254 RepID=A0ABS5KHX6_9ACTN|nr:Imm1 family immunity protein [Catenulispora pinistramenti]MBS2545480.1 hypothetical protein [Catenulispora pinistramenti]